ncbi:hypothetical protein L6249_00725 [Candidatus Parcubacteria bacterium]|nr:hypothetical protein [Candidatus Parcubacteria bacterium]
MRKITALFLLLSVLLMPFKKASAEGLWWKSGLIGAGAGALVGAGIAGGVNLLAYPFCDLAEENADSCRSGYKNDIPIAAGIGGILGFTIGLITGAIIEERQEGISVDVMVDPQYKAYGAGIRASF